MIFGLRLLKITGVNMFKLNTKIFLSKYTLFSSAMLTNMKSKRFRKCKIYFKNTDF